MEKGFTLLEVLVALAILGLVAAGTLPLLSTGLDTSQRATVLSRAVLHARSRLAVLGIAEPLVAGERRGDFGNGYTWVVSVAPYGGDAAGAIPAGTRLYRVAVTVAWGRRAADAVTLTTLRLSGA
ncbi:MAG TPA: type II secretion system protein [Azospirillaceae bacterium]|nr:type II secretion system protein [Azospirillaceae bacterium]